jgi:cytochrome c
MRAAAALSALALIGAAHADDGKVVRGEARFAECVDCHRLEPGVNNVGPSLHRIFTRKAGEVVDFSYSPAMKRSRLVWTPETLDKFIRDPQAMVPGNRMAYAGMINADDRADLLAFLLKATQY